MKIPKYWALGTQSATSPNGRHFALERWQWSDISLQDAQQQAIAGVAEVARKVTSGQPLNRYGYSDRPLREEPRQALVGRSGREVAVVTRNRYGALVLNAIGAMFIDIDFAEDQADDVGSILVGRLFGKKMSGPEEQALQRIQAWWEPRRDLSLRVYRTCAGLRCLITSHLFDPAGQEAAGILADLKSDPLYTRLCRAQECFRARLTPKPWRLNNMETPPAQYPWRDTRAEMLYRNWEQRYEAAIQQYATCRLIKQFGTGEVHPDVEPVLALHDRVSRVDAGLKLA